MNPDRPLRDDEVRLIVMRWANDERRIARRSLRHHVNAVRSDLGLPTVENDELARLVRQIGASVRVFATAVAPALQKIIQAAAAAEQAAAKRAAYTKAL